MEYDEVNESVSEISKYKNKILAIQPYKELSLYSSAKNNE